MGNMNAAAGGSGIAGLAQAVQGQANLAAQRDSASIGLQERQNQLLAARGEAQAQQLRIGGEVQARDLRQGQIATQFGIAMQREGAARETLAQSDQQMINTISQGFGMAAGGVAQGFEDGTFGDETAKIRRQAERGERRYRRDAGLPKLKDN